MAEELLPKDASRVCSEPDCKEWPLTFESTEVAGDISPLDGEIKKGEKYFIYRCDRCGARYNIKAD
ncbi:MAG: hypothetical protein PHE52_02665 [Candidatus Pacebacteria bacterium]|nr:hypothetical protein [Candidatus Paceibacterota bacterium]